MFSVRWAIILEYLIPCVLALTNSFNKNYIHDLRSSHAENTSYHQIIKVKWEVVLRGVVSNALDWVVVVSEFEFQTRYYVYITPAMG